MQYIEHTKGSNSKFPRTSHRVGYFKEKKEGQEEMCELVEKYAEERAAKVAKEVAAEVAKEAAKEAAQEAKNTARELFKNGATLDMALKSIKKLTADEITALYNEVMAEKA